MLYEKYLKRVKRLANILKTIRRFRVLIIVVMSVVFASAASFMAVQGLVYDSISCPTDIIYGEGLVYEAKAIFGDVRYEYASASKTDEWFESEPLVPGKYLVRAVSTSTFGTPRYGKSHAYTITPKNITVSVVEKEILYGETPSVTANLVYNDTIFCDGYTYEDISLKNTNIQALLDSIVIKDENGNDIKHYYNITAASAPISILSHSITVTLGSATVGYSGLPLQNTVYEITDGELVEGNLLYATIDSIITDAGEVENSASEWLIIDRNNNNVTAHYDITEIKGTLTVNKRPIYIETFGDSFVYDGLEHSRTDFELHESEEYEPLVNGHRIEAAEGCTRITDVGIKENILRFVVLDEKGNDVSSNYAMFLSTPKMIEVTKRPVTLSTGSLKLTYDDKYHWNDEYTISGDGLAEGHTPSYSDRIEVVDAGKHDNIVFLTVTDKDGKDVSTNYHVTYEYGVLEIKPIVLQIKTEGFERMYDGTPLVVNSYEILNKEAMVPGHSDSYASSVSITNVFLNNDGDVSGVANKVELTIMSAGGDGVAPLGAVLYGINDSTEARDVSKNYVLSYGENDQNAGILKLNPREIEVATHSMTFVYSGLPHQFLGFTESGEAEKGFSVISGTIADGEIIRAAVDSSASVTHVSQGEVDNLLSYEFYDGEGNLIPSQNYVIKCTPENTGRISVTPLLLSVQTMTKSFVYDGERHTYCDSDNGYTITAGALPEAHSLEIKETASVLNVTVQPVVNKMELALKYGEEYVAEDDYIISYDYAGMLTVTQRPVTIIADSDSKMYDGTPLTDTGYTVFDDEDDLFDSLVESHVVASIKVLGERTNVKEGDSDTTANVASDAVILFGKEDVTSNYNITYVDGELSITKRPILVGTASDEWTYDSTEHYNSEADVISEREGYYSLVGDHELVVVQDHKITNVWESGDNTFAVIVGDEDINNNYLISYEYGNLSIVPRELTVKSFDGTWMYDGEAHFSQEYDVPNGGYSVGGDGLGEYFYSKLCSNSSIINAYEENVKNTIEIKLYHIGTEEEVDTRNYTVSSYEYGALKIEQRPVLVKTEDGEWIYDGDKHSNSGFALVGDREGYYDLVGEHVLVLSKEYFVTNVFDSDENKLEVIVSNEQITKNYDISYERGTLTVNPRDITVTSNDGSWMYDGIVHISGKINEENGGYTIGGDGLGAFLYPYVTELSSVTNVYEGDVENKIKIKLHLNESDEEVDERNYNISSYEYGRLYITQRPILVQTASNKWTYDGARHSDSGIKLLEAENYYSLIGDHELVVSTNHYVTEVKDSGDNVFKVIVSDSLTTQNYLIDYEYGKLTVNVRNISLVTYDGSWMYDGNEHTTQAYAALNGGYYVGLEGLGDYLKSNLTYTSSVTNVYDGNVENKIEVELYLSESGEIVSTENYVIKETNFGTLSITKRPILVGTADDEWTYDSEEHYNGSVWIIEKEDMYYPLVGDHALHVFSAPRIVNVWESGYNTVKVIVGDDITTQNYDISYEYGKITVTPRQLKVDTYDGSWMYDGEFHYSAEYEDENGGYSVGGDGLGSWFFTRLCGKSGIKNVYDGPIDNIVNIELWFIESEMIVDERNYDVTYNSYGKLSITKRPILVQTGTETWVYDGFAHYEDSFTLLNEEGYYPLVSGDILCLYKAYSITNVWDSGNNLATAMVNDTVKTENYAISYRYGTITIDRREIDVESYDGYWTYDGNEHFSAEYGYPNGGYNVGGDGISGNLVPKLTKSGSVKNVKQGKVRNEIEIALYLASSGDPVDERNYRITGYTYGDLWVNVRNMTVVTFDGSWIYDGSAHSNAGYAYANGGYYVAGDGLASNLRFEIVDASEITNVWESGASNTIEVVLYVISDNAPSDIENYTVDYINGTLNITPRQLTVNSYDGSWMYDGEEHRSREYAVQNGGYGVGGDGLSSYLTSVLTKYSSVTNVYDGLVENVVEIKLCLKESGEDVDTRNYDVVYTSTGYLSITPRPISVKTGSGSWIYDGEAHGNSDVTVTNAGYSLVLDHKLVVINTFEIINTWETGPNYLEVIVNDELTTQNYEISYEYGTLEIKPRPIKVQTGTESWVYDAQPHSNDEAVVLVGDGFYDLVGDHKLVIVSHHVVTLVSDSGENRISVIVENDTINTNYTITYAYGTVTILPRKIVVETGSGSWVYDGKPHSNNSFWLVTGEEGTYDLVEGHELVLIKGHEITNAAESGPNRLEIIVSDEEINKNYEIDFRYGYLDITRAPLVIIANSKEKMYDGIPLADDGYSVYGLIEGHSIEGITVVGSQTEIGKSPNVVSGAVVYDADANDVTVNYDVQYSHGILEVLPLGIAIEFNSETFVYDGEAHSSPIVRITLGELADGHRITPKYQSSVPSITEVGSIENKFDIKIVDENGNDVTAYYNVINITSGYLYVIEKGVEPDDEDNPSGDIGGPGRLDTSGSLAGGVGDLIVDPVTVMKVKANKSGSVYMRLMSFGDYNGAGWDYATSYQYLLNGRYSFDYLTGITLGLLDYEEIILEVQNETEQYFLPYYLVKVDGEYIVPTNDVIYNAIHNGTYTVRYYQYIGYGENLSQDLGAVSGLELEYRNFVHKNYLNVDSKTRRFMQKIIDQQGFDINDPEIIKKVASYIQSAATYNSMYDRALDSESNIVIAFLETYQEGVCRHYASAATLLFRTLGIPARYTIGYAGNTEDGEWVDITSAQGHAWVEVYIDGVGWIMVEVTGSGSGEGGSGEGGSGEGGSGEGGSGEGGSGEGGSGEGGSGEGGSGEGGSGEGGSGEGGSGEGGSGDGGSGEGGSGEGGSGEGGSGEGGSGEGGSGEGGSGEGGSGEGGSGGGSTNLDDTGSIGSGGGPGGGSGGGPGEQTVVMTIKSTKTGKVYMRMKTFGDYTGSTWLNAESYPLLIKDKYSYDYLSGISLGFMGYEEVVLEVDSKTQQYFLPYYLVMAGGDYIIPTSDVMFNADHDGTYTVRYYQYTGYGKGIAQDLGAYAELEREYRKFVKQNYLYVDDETMQFMRRIISEQGFSLSDPDIIEKIATYIQSAAEYNLEYDPALDKESNIVIAFLEAYKEGTCSHYASAATLLYRALGIPARLVKGYVGDTVAGQWTDITGKMAHAWVEVYIDGVGWIMVEVTGGSGSGSGNGSGEGSGENQGTPEVYKPTITITPVSRDKTYDGTPLYALDSLVDTELDIKELLAQGYSYIVTVEGSQTEVGESQCYITSFQLFDNRGINVTGNYNIKYNSGTLRVMEAKKITVTVFELEGEYNGEILEYEPDYFYNITGISLDEYEVELSIRGGIINAGILEFKDIEYTLTVTRLSDGVDVSKEYYVSFEGIELTVNRRRITLIAASETRVYNGEALSNSSVTIAKGSGLLEGHRLVAEASGSIIDVGTVLNVINMTTIRVYDSNGNDVTSNYEFDCKDGLLTVIDG